MNDMIKAEREKILSRKQTKILFITGVILIIAYFFCFNLTIILYFIIMILGKWIQ